MDKKEFDKVQANIWIDRTIWELSQYVLPCSRSKWIENKLKEAVFSKNDLEGIELELKEIANERQRLTERENTLYDKQEKLMKIIEINTENEAYVQEVIETLTNTHNKKGALPKSIIANVCNRKKVDFNTIYRKCKENNLTVIEWS